MSTGLEVPARTTSEFLETFGVQVAINGGFFHPFDPGMLLWGYYPQSGDPVDVSGLAISNGEIYSANNKWGHSGRRRFQHVGDGKGRRRKRAQCADTYARAHARKAGG